MTSSRTLHHPVAGAHSGLEGGTQFVRAVGGEIFTAGNRGNGFQTRGVGIRRVAESKTDQVGGNALGLEFPGCSNGITTAAFDAVCDQHQ